MFNKGAPLALAAIVLVFASAASAQTCTLKQLTSLPIQRMADGAIAVPIKVAGAEETFLLGLNYPFSEIVGTVAETLNLRNTGIGKKVYTVKSFDIGAVKGTDTFFYTMHADEDAHGASGILGLDLLGHFDIELDLKHNKLNLFSPDHCPGQGVYWTTAAAAIPFGPFAPFGRIVLNAELDGKRVTIGMPSASQFHTVSSTGVLSKVFGIPENSPDLKPIPGSNPQAFRYPFKSLWINGVVMNNPAIDVYPLNKDLLCGDEWGRSLTQECYGGVEIQLGLDKLETLRLYFSVRENILYVTSADATMPSNSGSTSK